MSKQKIPQKLPQGGGSFLRQPDGKLERVQAPTTEPQTAEPAKPTAKPAKKEAK